MEKYITDERTGIRYELVGDYYLPIDFGIKASHDASVKGSPRPDRPAIGRFGRAHGEYLKQTQHHVYSQFAAEGKLGTYLAQIDEQANDMLNLLIRQMSKREGVTEELSLHPFKGFPVDDRLVFVFENHPVFLRILYPAFVFEGLGIGLEIDHVAAILLLCKDFLNGRFAPVVRILLRLFAAAVQSLAVPVCHGDKDLVVHQDMRDGFTAFAFHAQLEDPTHDLCGFGIDDPVLFVGGVLQVTVRRLRKRLAHVPAYTVRASHLPADITGVHLIHDVFERRDLVFSLVAVHQIVDGDNSVLYFLQ